jgi:flagellar biogenesis protein FliO
MKRPLASALVLALFGLTLAAPTHAEPERPTNQTAWLRKATPKPAPKIETKPALSPLRVSAMLALVAGLGGFAFYARKRRGGAKATLDAERLNVVSSTRLGPKAHAVVTQVSGKRLLLGVTEQSVTVLAWLDAEPPHAETPRLELAEPNELSGILEAPEPVDVAGQSPSPSGFLRLLRSAVGTGAASPAEEVALSTHDEVKVSRRAASEAREAVEGQAAGILRRKRAPK